MTVCFGTPNFCESPQSLSATLTTPIFDDAITSSVVVQLLMSPCESIVTMYDFLYVFRDVVDVVDADVENHEVEDYQNDLELRVVIRLIP